MNNQGPLDNLPLSDAEKNLLDKTPVSTGDAKLQALRSQLDSLPDDATLERAQASLVIAGQLLDMDRKPEAWQFSRPLVEVLIEHKAFEDAALACQYVYLAEQDDAIVAIGQAAWLAVTFPVDPNLTANILDHIIDETPDNADGAAVAAATAHFVVDVRSEEDQSQELRLFTGAMLARVAKRHSNIENQADFEIWVEKLELNDPDKFLVRLRNVVDVLVQDEWWFHRGDLRREFTGK
ncbi:MAG: hypothetical protein V3U76_04185 [Granulosicoccus sp.]